MHVFSVPVLFREELTEVSDTGIDVVPNLLKCPVGVPDFPKSPAPLLTSYPTCRGVRYRY